MAIRKETRFERLERRDLLAIDWVNEGVVGNDSDNFENLYGLENAAVARSIVNRAIDDWNAVIPDQNYDNDNDPTNNGLALTILAASLGSGISGQQMYGSFTEWNRRASRLDAQCADRLND